MISKLIKNGDDYSLTIDRRTLALLSINPDADLDISTDGRVLIISPIRDAEQQKKLEAALERVNEKYADALKRLAE